MDYPLFNTVSFTVNSTLFYTNGPSYTDIDDWILATGFWNDAAMWIDTAHWND